MTSPNIALTIPIFAAIYLLLVYVALMFAQRVQRLPRP